MYKNFIRFINAIVLISLIGIIVFSGVVTTASAQAAGKFYVEFNASGGEINGQEISRVEAAIYNRLYVIPMVGEPVRNGFIFEYWITDDGAEMYEGDALNAEDFIPDGTDNVFKLTAKWKKDPDSEIKEEDTNTEIVKTKIPDAVQTVDVLTAGKQNIYKQRDGKDIAFLFAKASIDQFSGFAMDFKTTARYGTDYHVYDTDSGVMLILTNAYIESLEKGNHTAVLFFTRNNPNPCGAVGLADLIIE